MKKVVVTGASGFIGRHVVESLVQKDYVVYALARSGEGLSKDTEYIAADILDQTKTADTIKAIKPEFLMHLAWYPAHGDYWTSRENFQWVEASTSLLKSFNKAGGQRAVMAGTCAEYDWAYGHCSENKTPLNPATPYGVCKNTLHQLVETYSLTTNMSYAWARLFYLFGPYEHPSRLIPHVINKLLKNAPAECSSGTQIRDFLFIKDAAEALCMLLESGSQGPVNIASGEPIALKRLIETAANRLGKIEFLRLGALPIRSDEPPVLTADTTRLRSEIGWAPAYNLEEALDLTIQWWKAN